MEGLAIMVNKKSIQQKLELARQELLDLGLRNPLLNYRTLKAKGLEIVKENPTDVYRILVSDKKNMTFEALRKEYASSAELEGSNEDDLTPFDDEVALKDDDAIQNLDEKYLDSKLQTHYTEQQLERRLLNTYHFARTYIEEQGVNILYMALGMLNWTESESSQEVRKAPLILIPVKLERVSASEKFNLSYTEDEIGENISLQAKMKAEYMVDIPSLPEDSGLLIDDYFLDVKKATEGLKGWSVDTKSIVVGFFSFGKFLMFRDLDVETWPEHSRPESHSIMTALLEEGFQEDPSLIEENDHIDQHLNLVHSNLVVDADSSQTTAILDAKQGRNMVIQGPPGTGKSQTITNLIAEAIANGKKVLFVSEKMAALEVVKRRLDSLGLGVACLELHSHKTNKKALLNELASTLELGKPRYDEEGGSQLLDDLRLRLNEYSFAVNTVVEMTGVTPYQALGYLVQYQIENKDISFPKLSIESFDKWNKVEYKKRETLVEELQLLINTIGTPKFHPFWGSTKKVVLPAEVDTLKHALAEAGAKIKHLRESLLSFVSELRYPMPNNANETSKFFEVLKRALDAPSINEVHLKSELWLKDQDILVKWLEAGIKNKALHNEYDSRLLPEAWDQDLLESRQILIQYQHKWWKFFSSEYRKAKNKVLGLCKNPKENLVSLLEYVEAIMESRRLNAFVTSHDYAKELFPSRWKGDDTNWDSLGILIPWIINVHKDIQQGTLPNWILEFLSASPDVSNIQIQLEELTKKTEYVEKSIDVLEELLEFDASLKFDSNYKLKEHDYSKLEDMINTWQEHVSKIQEMASYNQLISICNEEALGPLVKLSESWELSGKQLLGCFRWHWNQSIVSNAFQNRPALATFDRTRHEQAIQKFRELDQYIEKINRVKLAEKHWVKLPIHEAGGQLGVLRREFEKKTRHLPIRQLMSKAGHAIQAIKPVFMMGPLSIATYLEPGSLEFDLVIFDEASQVKPVDAFGAILRAKQAIVVGDSKQMPPTNFFDSIAKEEGDEDNFVSDMESILGLFVGQNAPQRMLRWHYRSRHESLITVSNYEFYENKLVIFPSPDANKNHSGLIYNYLPETFYDRGRTRTNKLEAKAVAEAVLLHARRYPELTLGVAAFSMAQMQAILDEVEIIRRANPSIESFFAKHPHEPFFVKNLENVQGDERDVIFISIGYGKTKEGYLAMDFGALNREGGERRLNVLITRARIRCEVFTNLRSDDIDLNRTNSRGVKALKTFLKYAESGNLDIPIVTGKDIDSPFEEAVYRSLTQLGYEVKAQIGSAGFFVDLAIVDPDTPGKYVLGIECDGATYHSARSARDRDRLRQQVLESLGWKIHRIWSTDWFRHPERELKRVVEAVEKAKVYNKTDNEVEYTEKQRTFLRIQRDNTIEKEAASNKVEKYVQAELDIHLNGREFHNLPLTLIASWVNKVIEVESPVHASEVMKRISEALGIKRVGSRIKEVFEQSFSKLHHVDRRGDFFWIKEMNVPKVRDRSELKNKKFEHISPDEIKAAILEVVSHSFGIEQKNVYNTCVQLLGFIRVNEEAKAIIDDLINKLVDESLLIRKGEVLLIKN